MGTSLLVAWSARFFSSRRRHTRYWRDWSSDVCSSDLYPHHVGRPFGAQAREDICWTLAEIARGARNFPHLAPRTSKYLNSRSDAHRIIGVAAERQLEPIVFVASGAFQQDRRKII